jgi:hypothetical protein
MIRCAEVPAHHKICARTSFGGGFIGGDAIVTSRAFDQ